MRTTHETAVLMLPQWNEIKKSTIQLQRMRFPVSPVTISYLSRISESIVPLHGNEIEIVKSELLFNDIVMMTYSNRLRMIAYMYVRNVMRKS